ncbi:MAG TPA: hypothetical protein PLN21_15515 [Gemmatales bacterium]|nr:hypothetical protein [Gemmatales bacterium]
MRHLRHFVAVALLVGLVIVHVQTQQSGTSETVIPFTLTSQNNIVVQAFLNGGGALKLMLHTASSGVTLTEEGAKKAKMVFTGSTEMKSWGGGGTSRWSKGNKLLIGSFQQGNLTVHENKNSGEGTDGKFGLDIFGKRMVEIDFGRSLIVLHEKLPAKADRYTRLKMENRDGDLFVPGNCLIEGKDHVTRFLLHTGYSGGLLLDDEFVAKAGVEGRIKITSESSLKDSFGHTIKVKNGILPAFVLGKTTISEVPVGFFAGAVGAQKMSVLGCEVLKRFNVILDLANNELYLDLIRR